MNDAKHTPGPWRLKDNGSMEGPHVYGPVHPIDGGDYAPLAGYRGGALSMGDAHLIAAAPDLLEACKAAWAELDNRYDVDEPEPGYSKEYPFNGAGKLMRRLQAAIRKAEGKS